MNLLEEGTTLTLDFGKLAKVDELSYKAFEDQCTTANPVYPLVSEIKELYLQAYYGK